MNVVVGGVAMLQVSQIGAVTGKLVSDGIDAAAPAIATQVSHAPCASTFHCCIEC
jgi:hypothetical protein